MHPLFFSIKRVHWLWQRRAQKVLFGRFASLTPAQFDLLRTLFTYKDGIVRFKLAALLGVAASGVSRMVKKLEEYGLVSRTRYDHDKRCVRVKLTEDGYDHVEEILGWGDEWDPAPLLVDILDEEAKKWFSTKEDHVVELDVLGKLLTRARFRQYETAIYPVPWHGGEVLYGEPGTIAEPPPLGITVAA